VERLEEEILSEIALVLRKRCNPSRELIVRASCLLTASFGVAKNVAWIHEIIPIPALCDPILLCWIQLIICSILVVLSDFLRYAKHPKIASVFQHMKYEIVTALKEEGVMSAWVL
jgi:hypothetical protein